MVDVQPRFSNVVLAKEKKIQKWNQNTILLPCLGWRMNGRAL